MKRRDFFKVAGVGSLAVVDFSIFRQFASLSPGSFLPGDSLVNLNGQLFKGTPDGRIMVSEDGGDSWMVCANFGKHLWVKNLSVSDDQLWAEICLPGASFKLSSSNGRVWRTVA